MLAVVAVECYFLCSPTAKTKLKLSNISTSNSLSCVPIAFLSLNPCTNLCNSNLGIYPGSKIQLQNCAIMDGMLVLKPSNVLWIGGDVESFSSKLLKAAKSRDKDTRVFQKNLAKNETPPPQFEDIDLTMSANKKKAKKYETVPKHYSDERLYNDSYQKAKGGGYNKSNLYDDGGYDGYGNDTEYYPDQKHDAYEETKQQSQSQRYERKRKQHNDYRTDMLRERKQQRKQDRKYVAKQQAQSNGYIQNGQDLRYQTQSNRSQRYEAPQNNNYGHNEKYVSPRRQIQQNSYSQKPPRYQQQAQQSQSYAPRQQLPRNLMELYGVQSLPFVATLSVQIVAAKLNFTQQSHEPYIEFDVSDSTGKCKAMTSTHLMQWICSKYGTLINQQMVDAFYNQWGNRYIISKMELKDKARMIIFHEIKWQ